MNTSFDPLDLVNTYGAFGSVGRERDEIVLEGTDDPVPGDDADWRAYEFKCKPGDPMRRPCVVSPYHYRLDWLMWFAAMSRPEAYPWTLHLVWKLLHADPGALGLLAGNPFPGRAAALHPRLALPLPLRAARRSERRVVEARAPGDVAPAAVSQRSPAARIPREPRVAALRRLTIRCRRFLPGAPGSPPAAPPARAG